MKQDFELLIKELMQQIPNHDENIEEGLLSKILGTAAVAGSLALGSPSEAKPSKVVNNERIIGSNDIPAGYETIKSRIDKMGVNDWTILNRIADKYGLKGDERKLLFVMRIVENGRPGKEMGQGDFEVTPNEAKILWKKYVTQPWKNEITGEAFKSEKYLQHPAKRYEGYHDKSLEVQASWAAGGIKKHYNGDLMRFAKYHCPELAGTPYKDSERWYKNALHYMKV